MGCETFIDTSRDQAVGDGFWSPNGSIKDKDLAVTLRRYRQRVASAYRAIMPGEIKDMLQSKGPFLVSPKIDGELWFMIFEGDGEVFLANPRGAAIRGGMPLLEEAGKLAKRVTARTIVAGELFALSKGARPRVGDLASAMAGGKGAQVKRIGFQGFDLLHGSAITGHDAGNMEEYANRIEAIRALLEGGKRVQAVRTEEARDTSGVKVYFDEWVDGGKAEGVVVRPQKAEGRTYKIKPMLNVDAAVVGYTVRAAEPNQTRSVLLALARNEGQLQLLGSCGNFGGDEMRAELLPKLKELEVPSAYRHASSDGSLYRFVKPELVMEIRITDVQSEDSRGDPIRRMVLEHDGETWKGIALMPGVSILHPVFQRLRDDKSTSNQSDIRVEQVLDRCLVRDATTEAKVEQLKGSEVIRREAYAKTTKDKLAVRKLLVWKTNKEDAGGQDFPAYVVHWTDYSPGRKAPLQRTVKVAPDVETVDAIVDGLLKKGVKKGWELVE